MRTVLREAGNRLLAKLLPAAEAGACVPEHGTCCAQRGYRYDCNGICQKLRCGCRWYPIGC